MKKHLKTDRKKSRQYSKGPKVDFAPFYFSSEDDVVDADFEEVKDDEKK